MSKREHICLVCPCVGCHERPKERVKFFGNARDLVHGNMRRLYGWRQCVCSRCVQLGKLRGSTGGQLDEVAAFMAKMTSVVELNLVTKIYAAITLGTGGTGVGQGGGGLTVGMCT